MKLHVQKSYYYFSFLKNKINDVFDVQGNNFT